MTWEKIEHPLQCWPYTFGLPQLKHSLQLSVLKLVEMSFIPWHWGEGCAEISFVLSKVRSRLVPRWEFFLKMARMLSKMPYMQFLKKWHQWRVQTFSRYFVLNIWILRLGKILPLTQMKIQHIANQHSIPPKWLFLKLLLHY